MILACSQQRVGKGGNASEAGVTTAPSRTRGFPTPEDSEEGGVRRRAESPQGMFHSFTGVPTKFLSSVCGDGGSSVLAGVLTDGD
jgi:hypothetical protein